MSALDDFAATLDKPQQTVALPAVISHPAPPQLVHGAQLIAGDRRDVPAVLRELSALANAHGDGWFYSIPFKDKKTGKTTYVEGPSIKLADQAVASYGNCAVDSWVSGEGVDYWEITARVIDLERGSSLSRPYRQRKNAARVGSDEARNQEIAFAIGVSKAERNVICRALATYVDYAFEEARGALVNKVGKDVEGWQEKVVKRLDELKVPLARVEAVVGRPARDWTARDIAKVVAMAKTVADGMATLNETFPTIQSEPVNAELDKIAKATDKGGKAEASAAGASTPPETATGPTQPPADAPQPVAVRAVYSEMVQKLLKLATDQGLTVQQALEELDHATPIWQEQMPDHPERVKTAVATAARVAKGTLSPEDARKYLMAL
jgi:hypothetical protein